MKPLDLLMIVNEQGSISALNCCFVQGKKEMIGPFSAASSTGGLQRLFSCFEYAAIPTDHQSSAVFLQNNTHMHTDEVKEGERESD